MKDLRIFQPIIIMFTKEWKQAILGSYQNPTAALSLVAYLGLATITCIAITMATTTRLCRDRRLDSIPGPKLLPLVGVGYKLPADAPLAFRRWALEHGDIFRIRVGWYDWVVLNTPEAVREILEKQAVSTSSKAPSPLGHDVVTGGKRMPTMPYGPHWRAQRAVVRQVTTAQITASLLPSQEFEAKQLLADLAADSQNENQRDFYQHMRRYAFSIIMTNTFGTRVKSWDHPDVHDAVRSQAILRKTSRPGAFLVDELPPLARLPTWLQPGRRRAEEAAKEVLAIKMNLWRRLEAQHAEGRAPPCFARGIAESKDAWRAQGLDDEDLAWVAGGLVEAGFETTAATLNSLVLHLAAAPHAQQAAHDELARVVGPGRAPAAADLPRLPYVRACVKEMLRLNPILSPGIRHYADRDVEFRGHTIPRGTMLVANTAFLHRDPRRFEAPDEFRPERYLGHDLASADYAALGDPVRRDHFAFSTGRRTCPGARTAENSLGIALAGVLWAFEIRPPVVDGVEVPVDTSTAAYADEGFTIPKPFAARFLPRSDEALEIVKRQWEEACRTGYELRGMPVDIDGIVQY